MVTRDYKQVLASLASSSTCKERKANVKRMEKAHSQYKENARCVSLCTASTRRMPGVCPYVKRMRRHNKSMLSDWR